MDFPWSKALRFLYQYLFRGGLVRDWTEIIRHWRDETPDVLFFSSASIDTVWLESTIAACRNKGLQCVHILASFRHENASPESIFRHRVSPLALPFFRAKIAVTASTGLGSMFMPRICRHRVHMPHSLVSLHMAYPNGTFDHFDVIFCCGPHHMAEAHFLRNKRGRGPTLALPVGYGKFDVLIPETAPTTSPQKEILIAPSWQEGNVLENHGGALIRSLLNTGFAVTARPHPMVFREKPELIDLWQSEFGLHPAFTLDESRDGQAALGRADVMISDFSGVAMEFSMMRRKPVVFVDGPMKICNASMPQDAPPPLEITVRNELGFVVGPATTDILEGVNFALTCRDTLRKRIDSCLERRLYNLSCCGEVASEAILAIIHGRP